MAEFASSINDIRDQLKGLVGELDTSAQAMGQYARAQDTVNQAWQNLGKSINIFDRDVRENRQALIDASRASEQYQAQLKSQKVRQEIARISTEHWTRALVDLGNKAKAASSFVVNGLGAMGEALKGATKSVGGLKQELLDFNRASFEASRTAKVLGINMDLSDKAFSDVNKRTALSKTQFLSLQNTMLKLSDTTVLTNSQMRDMAAVLQERLGPSFEATKDGMERIIQLNNKLPGLRDQLIQMAQATDDFSRTDRMANLTLLMNEFGASIRDLDVANRVVAPLNDTERQMLKFEKAVAKRDQAIQDMNVNTAKTAEETMIRMEKLMTKITIQIDKILQKFTMLPKAFIYMKQIAAVSFGGMVTGLMGLIRYVEQLGVSATTTTAKLGQMNSTAATAGAARAGAGMMRGIGTVGAVATVAYNMYRGYQQSRGAAGLGRNATIEEQYAAEAQKNAGIGRMVGTGAGAVIGGLVGGPVGAMVGAGVGGMAGQFVGGKFGPDEDEMRTYGQIAAALDKQQLKVEGIIRSEKDVLNVINKQVDAEDKARAIRTLVREGLMKEDKLRELAIRHGNQEIVQLIKQKKEHDALLKRQEEESKYSMARIRALRTQLTLLKANQKVFGEISKNSESIGDTLVEAWSGGLASREFERAAEYSSKVLDSLRDSSEVLKELYTARQINQGTNLAKGAQESALSSYGIEGADAKGVMGAYEEVLRLKKKIYAVKSDTERRDAKKLLATAKELYKKRVDELNIDKQIREELKQRATLADAELDRLAAAAPLQSEMMLAAERIAKARATQQAKMKGTTAVHESSLNFMDAQLRIQRLQASVAEKTAAGYAVSYAHQKQIYDTLVSQRGVSQDMLQQLEKSAPQDIWQKHGAALEKAGVKMTDLNDLTKNRNEIINKINAAVDKGEGDVTALQSAEAVVNDHLHKQMDIREKILSLQEQELDMAMNLREGYLDVINEMTTGRDMMSQLLPDANRGIMALQELSTRVQGQAFGGAMKRGFVSFTPFAEAQDLSKAPRFTKRGFVPPSRSAVVQTYQKQVQDMLNATARGGGPGTFAGQANLGMSGAFAAGTPGGGVARPQALNTTKTDVHTASVQMRGTTTMNATHVSINAKNIERFAGGIPKAPSPGGGPGTTKVGAPALPQQRAYGGFIDGPASDRDNRLGVVDGRELIGLASGEYVVNARSARKYGPLLEALNREGRGMANGGPVDFGFASAKTNLSYHEMSLLDLLAAAKKGDPVAKDAFIRKYKRRGHSDFDARFVLQTQRIPGLVEKGAKSVAGFGMSVLEKDVETSMRRIEKGIDVAGSITGVVTSVARDLWHGPQPRTTIARDTARAKRIEAEAVAERSRRATQMDKIRTIKHEMSVRPGLSEFINQKTGGRKSRGAWISAYEEFMATRGAIQDASIANEKEAMAVIKSDKSLQAMAKSHYRMARDTGLVPREAKRAALYEVSRLQWFHGVREAKRRSDKYWPEPDAAVDQEMKKEIRKKKGPRIMGMSLEDWEKQKRKSQEAAGLTVFRGKEEIMRKGVNLGLAEGGAVGALAALMSGTVNIGSLNVNGQTLAKNLSGANDMSIAMERARQNHSH